MQKYLQTDGEKPEENKEFRPEIEAFKKTRSNGLIE